MPYIPAEFSDLFFNHTHHAYDALYSEEGTPSAQEIADAVLEDVTQFRKDYPMTCDFFGESISVYALQQDFLHRL